MKFLFIICIIQFCYPIDVGSIEAYFIEDYQLFRPIMNKDNTLISADVYTSIVDASEGKIKDEIVLFKRDGYKDAFFIHLIDDFSGDKEILNTGLVEWSYEDSEIFYSVKKAKNENFLSVAKIKNLNNQIASLYKTKNGNIFTHIQDLGEMGINSYDSDNIKKYKLMSYYDEDDFKNRDVLFLLYKDKDHNLFFKSNHNNYSEKGQSVIDNIDNFNVQDFDVIRKKDEDDYNFVFQIDDNQYQNRINFLCYNDGYIDVFTPLYPSIDDEKISQINPRFNFSGDKIAFLNFQKNSSGHFELFMVDISESKDCFDFNGKFGESKSSGLKYKKIDSNIVSNDSYGGGFYHFSSFCWHPEKDIIFYIKKENLSSETKNFSIYYYDFKNNIGPKKLNIPTNYNKYISISNDGEYLLFSFSGIQDGYSNFRFSNDISNDKELYKTSSSKIGVAKLIYD